MRTEVGCWRRGSACRLPWAHRRTLISDTNLDEWDQRRRPEHCPILCWTLGTEGLFFLIFSDKPPPPPSRIRPGGQKPERGLCRGGMLWELLHCSYTPWAGAWAPRGGVRLHQCGAVPGWRRPLPDGKWGVRGWWPLHVCVCVCAFHSYMWPSSDPELTPKVYSWQRVMMIRLRLLKWFN